jgi:hypothetical protein
VSIFCDRFNAKQNEKRKSIRNAKFYFILLYFFFLTHVNLTFLIANVLRLTAMWKIKKKRNVLKIHSKQCHRCVVIYEKHKNVLQYKESECEEKDHFKLSALTSRSVIKSELNRGVANASHPNVNGKVSTSDRFYRSYGDRDRDDCKQNRPQKLLFFCFSFPK